MKLVIQRCQEASVSVAGETVGTIQNGLMVLIGVGKDDTEDQSFIKRCEWLIIADFAVYPLC